MSPWDAALIGLACGMLLAAIPAYLAGRRDGLAVAMRLQERQARNRWREGIDR